MDLSQAAVDDATQKQLNCQFSFPIKTILAKLYCYYSTMHLRSIFIILFICIVAMSYGQSRKSKKKSKKPAPATAASQPTALDPLPQKVYAPKASRKTSKGPTYESEEKYYERMAQLAKTKRKNETLQDKPQYSDPMYFGHKRPPKKHKPGKMKFCRECGIRH